MARPLLLLRDASITKNIAGLIAAGNPVKAACWATGVSEATFYLWQEKGEAIAREIEAADDPEAARAGLDEASAAYLEFYEAIKRARGAAIASRIKVIRQAADDGTWQAAAWWLERMYPDEFGRRERIEVKDDRAVRDPLAERVLTDEEVRGLVNDLLARIAGESDTGWAGEAE